MPADLTGPSRCDEVTFEVFRSEDGRVFANVNRGGVQLAHLKAGQSYKLDLASSETERNEIERLKVALRQAKAFVVGERVPNWADEVSTYLTRGKIADICDFALAYPSHPRDIHLDVELRTAGERGQSK